MSLRTAIVRRCLQSCLKAAGVRAVNLPHVVDARRHVDLHLPLRLDAGYLVVDRRAFARIVFPPAGDVGAQAAHTTGFRHLEAVLRAICAERIGLAGRAAMPGPKLAVELKKAGRWQEVLDASERVEAPMRASLERWLGSWRFAGYRLALGVFKRF